MTEKTEKLCLPDIVCPLMSKVENDDLVEVYCREKRCALYTRLANMCSLKVDAHVKVEKNFDIIWGITFEDDGSWTKRG